MGKTAWVGLGWVWLGAPNNIEVNGRRRCLHSASIYTTQGGELEGPPPTLE